MTVDRDDSQRLVQAVQSAAKTNKPISICGHSSKSRFVNPCVGDALHTSDHSGILEYRPDELMISVRSGTPLGVVVDTLNENQQMLACDPPQFDGRGTVGGAVACDLNGPGRPWYGTIRDAVLGVELINGLGDRLNFGGRVMKNVAGFDISRLMAGSLGVFGVMLSVNLRVHPKPEIERSVVIDVSEDDAHNIVIDSLGKPGLITATCYNDGNLWLRLSGSASGVASEIKALDDVRGIDNDFWSTIRDHTHSFFADAEDLHRVSLDRGRQFESQKSEPFLIEWAGSRVWLQREPDLDKRSELDWEPDRFQRALGSATSQSKHVNRLRQAFDPNGIFNQDITFS